MNRLPIAAPVVAATVLLSVNAVCGATVDGHVFNDLNANGRRDAA